MRNSLILPPYSEVAKYEGQGNFAVRKYYQWPYSLFYRHKLNMILDFMHKPRYKSILDYGCGLANIFGPTLSKRTSKLVSFDKDDPEPIGKFELIVCASVLEFVDLDYTLKFLKKHLVEGGEIIGASPMTTTISSAYLRLIGDKSKRNPHYYVLRKLNENFNSIYIDEWCGLYYSFKGIDI